MKPAAFDYLAPTTVAEARTALADDSAESRVLAGGQSLVLEMHYRHQRPSRLVDINGIAELDYLNVDDRVLHVGALARHRAFESSAVAAGPLGRLLARTAPHIAHPPIRARGTLLGSLAWANPASEWPAVALALDAELVLTSTSGTRTVSAEDYFQGPFITARSAEELLVEARLPVLETGGVGFDEHRRTHASFPQIAVVTAVTVQTGVITAIRLALAGAADRPIRARAAEQHLLGAPACTESFTRAAELAAAHAHPSSEPHGDADYKRHVVAVLVRRALQQAYDDDRETA